MPLHDQICMMCTNCMMRPLVIYENLEGIFDVFLLQFDRKQYPLVSKLQPPSKLT